MHGQRVSSIFHDGDFIIDANAPSTSIDNQVTRMCNILFGSNKIAPTRQEHGMFIARAVSLTSLDLSRQVGAAIFSADGEVISLGSNEVPKAGGGSYWLADGNFDDREYMRGRDSNQERKTELLREIAAIADVKDPIKFIADDRVRNSEFMDALEYGRVVHAEMIAICDAARRGRALSNATLVVTTFPCHMCAKHIIAAGISKVIYLEPYPKSLTPHLHADSVVIESADRGRYVRFPSVQFDHFYGVSPRRYRELFERNKRKDSNGRFVEWKNEMKRPNIDIHFPVYLELEGKIAKTAEKYLDKLGLNADMIRDLDSPQ
jgi:deoxycytidylate deaminase